MNDKSVKCLKCDSSRIFRDGFRVLPDGFRVQRFLCRECGYRFSDKTNIINSSIKDHQLCAILQEAKKLDTATEIKTVAGDKNSDLIKYAWHEKKRGLSESTIAHRIFRLKVMIKHGADLNDPDSFLTVLMTENFSASSKYHYIQSYISYAKAFKIPFEKPHINYEPKEQYTPKPFEVTTLIQNLGKNQATLCQTLADTGARIGELARLLWSEIDDVGKVVFINHPEKGSKARKITVSDKTITMLMSLPKNYGKNVFNPNKRVLQNTFAKSRNRIAKKLCMPNLLKIHHHSFRRYYADQTYKKSRFNVRKVQARLGHKHLSSTEKYFGTFDDENCTYETARAYTIDDQEELRQLGYELYDTGIDEQGRTVKLYSRLK